MILTLSDLRWLRSMKILPPDDAIIDDRPEHARRDEYCDRLMADILRVTEEEQ